MYIYSNYNSHQLFFNFTSTIPYIISFSHYMTIIGLWSGYLKHTQGRAECCGLAYHEPFWYIVINILNVVTLRDMAVWWSCIKLHLWHLHVYSALMIDNDMWQRTPLSFITCGTITSLFNIGTQKRTKFTKSNNNNYISNNHISTYFN